jgi:hypothetical protein
MKLRPRYILALTLVATTLCAGRLFASDQNTQSEARLLSEKFVARITKSFSRIVSRGPVLVQQRTASPIPQLIVVISTDRSLSLNLSPCQFRLPPPSI